MSPIQQQIEVAADPSLARSMWARFIQWARTGPGRLACDELACTDAIRAGLVDFVPAQPGRTLVVFRLDRGAGDPASGGDPPAGEVERQLRHDLVVFKDYVERSGPVEREGAAARIQAAEQAAVKVEAELHGDNPRHTRVSNEGDATFWRSHFPT